MNRAEPTTTDDWIALPDAPAIPGLRFRFYRGEGDIPAIVEVDNAYWESMGETERWSVETLQNELRHPTHLPPTEARVLAFVDARLVADSSIEYEDTTDGERHYHSVGHIHPDWRRRGLGRAMMADSERRLRELATREAHPGPRKLITWLDDPNLGGIALARERGYRKVRIYHHMTRPDMDDIDVAPLPEGIEVRPVTRAMLPQVFDAAAEAFRDHFGGHDFSDAARTRWIDDPLMDPGLLVVAFDGAEVAAGVQGVIDTAENEANGYRRGWTDPVFTRKAWRRRGLAYALLGRALQRLQERGMTSAQLGVDSENENQALTLYERHRFGVDRSVGEWHKALEQEA
jgi:ribosomal protein S18 acetylase RimI-like enzyme